MTDAPFRELFVELPRALFESLQAIGEAAVAEAQQQPAAAAAAAPQIPRPDRSLFSQRHIRLVMSRYGWRAVELQYEPLFLRFALVAALSCGHLQRFQIDEIAIIRCTGPIDEIGLLDCAVDNTPRRCYCVQRQEVTIP